MNLACLQENLRRGLSMISRAVAAKSTLPVLSNVLLATDKGRLKLTATNLDIGVSTWIGAKIVNDGAITLPAKLLNDIVANLPNDHVDLVLDAATATLRLTCARSDFVLSGIPADEFPVIPSFTQHPIVTMPATVLRNAIHQVAFAAAVDNVRPVLAGVSLRVHGTTATFTATDGFRLSQCRCVLEEAAAEPCDVIIPARALLELARSFTDVDDSVAITLTPGGGQVLFQATDVELVSRLIDGRFPDVARIIPQAHTTRAVIDRQEFARIVKLASYLASSAAHVIKLELTASGDQTPGTFIVSAQASEVGTSQNVRDGIVYGEDGTIMLNAGYVADAVQAISTSEFVLELQTGQSPAVFKPIGAEEYVHVIMPMNVR